MAKKTYNIEFIYSDKSGTVKQHSIANIDKVKKGEVIQKICQWLVYEKEAINIAVKETYIYKVL